MILLIKLFRCTNRRVHQNTHKQPQRHHTLKKPFVLIYLTYNKVRISIKNDVIYPLVHCLERISVVSIINLFRRFQSCCGKRKKKGLKTFYLVFDGKARIFTFQSLTFRPLNHQRHLLLWKKETFFLNFYDNIIIVIVLLGHFFCLGVKNQDGKVTKIRREKKSANEQLN